LRKNANMLNIVDVDIKAALERIEGMQKRIATFEHTDIREEVRNWETRDVRRHRPGAKSIRGGGAKVIFRPHSRYEMRRARAAMRRTVRKGRYYVGRLSMRPILRRFLIDRLTERMSELMAEKLRW
jgi:hypothetical protein